MPSSGLRTIRHSIAELTLDPVFIVRCRSTRRDWLLQAGAGFGGLALLDLLGARRGGRARAVDASFAGFGPVAPPGDGPERHLPVHGRGAEPSRYVRPQTRAQPPGRPAAAAELQAGDHAHGRRPRAAPGLAAEVEAARPEWDLGLRLAAAHRHLRRRHRGDPFLLVQRVEPRRGRLPDEHGLDAGRPSLAGELGDLRAGHREREPARLRRDAGHSSCAGGRRPAELGHGLHAGGLPGDAARQRCRADRQPENARRESARRGRKGSSISWAGSIAVISCSRLDQSELDARIKSYELAFRMQAEAPEAVDLSRETAETLALYGLDDPATETTGRLCLLARRLVERGVRFVQIYCGAGSKWDAHADIEGNHAQTCRAMDQPVAGLLKDLKRRGLLDETLVVWGGEFGRTPMSEKGNGRDHNPYGFTMWMAGGGVKPGIVVGKTDDLGLHAIEDRLHVHDIHATILHALGVDHTKLIYRHQGRPERPTVNEGQVFRGLFKV